MAPSDDPECTCFRLRRAAREVSQLYDRALAAVDLSLNEYSILRHASAEPRTLGDLAAALGMDRSTLTRNARPLVDAGWLAEQRGDDARQRLLAITASGRRQLTRARPLWLRSQRQVHALFGDTATRRLHTDLEALHRRLSTADGGAP